MASTEKIKKDEKSYGSVQYTKIQDDEKDSSSSPSTPAVTPVPYSQLFRFAEWPDLLALFFGIVFAFIHGALTPLFPVIFGQMINAFDPTQPGEESIRDSIKQSCISFIIIGAVAFFTSYGQLLCFLLSSQRQALKIRKLYLRSLFRQEMGWYDVNDSGELLTHVAGDALLIQEGIGEKLGTFIQFISMFFGGFIVGFVYSWKMSLVILSVTPIIGICGAFLGKLMADYSTKGQAAYAKAGGIAEEVISCIRTVAAFSGEKSEIARYGERVIGALKEGEKTGHIVGAGLGVTFGVMFSSYGLAFWYGSKLIESGEMEAGDVTTVFFSIIMGAMALGQATPNISNFAKAKGAAVHVFEVIDRIPKIDSLSDEGRQPAFLKGNINFSKVHFTYPSRPDAKILKGIDLEVNSGKTIALVGASGCGKSTVVGLIQRFYDTESGSVTIDGVPITEYSVKWLRSQIGVVSQEPILFAKSIRENISFGREGVSMEEIEAAAKKANAHSFITRLPSGYETLVGERGAQLSGGQKQRVAIARAIVRDPKILLLDEATSALDSESEKLVQAALDEASKGRTTVIVAHRLSTIRNADTIFVFDEGVIAEQGTHAELMEKQGIYFRLVERQTMNTGEDQDTENKSEREKAVLKRRSTKMAEDKDVEEKKEKLNTDGVVWRSMKLNLTEWPFIVVGFFASIGAGIIFPMYSFIFSSMLDDLLFLRGEELEAAALYWGIAFLILGGLTAVSNYLQVAMFSISGERLTERMRNMLFHGIVRQNVGWFDDKANSTGILTTKLNNDASLVKGATGQRLGSIVQMMATLIGGLAIAFSACWQLTLAITAVVPLVAASGAFRMKLMMGFNADLKKAYEDSGHIASEAIENIRTVSSLGRHENFLDDYTGALNVPEQQGVKGAWVSGATFGFSEMMTFLIWAFAFWYGTELVLDGKTEFEGMMKAISAVVFGATMLGQTMTLAPDYGKAKISAASIFEIVDRVPPIDHFSKEGTRLDHVHGEVEFSNVVFSYPSRPEVKVLKGLTLTVKSGETLALVGSSGCGKSTVVSLLERFYLPESGHILLDGIETSSLNLNWLRHQIGIVGQEPVLFATSIRDNIAYGKPDATEEEIVEAAKKANAHSFITLLPAGYNTLVGEKGSQLSGGQKQRVAIARALVRNPKILLLDEATSALDAESEKVVQEALERASEGRTTIVIAHRLSTIKNASCIAVIDQGRVVEKGTHNELMSNNGLYHNLVLTQVNPL